MKSPTTIKVNSEKYTSSLLLVYTFQKKKDNLDLKISPQGYNPLPREMLL